MKSVSYILIILLFALALPTAFAWGGGDGGGGGDGDGDGDGGWDEDPIPPPPPPNVAPSVAISHPDSTHKNFVVNHNVRVIASATDGNGDSLTYTVNFGDGQSASGSVSNSAVNVQHTYASVGTYTITVTVSDGSLTASDSTTIIVWPHGFNITNLNSYSNSDFTTQSSVFYRNDPLYLKFDVVQKDAGFKVANNINYVYIYNRDNPSSIYNLSGYNGVANGVTVSNGQPSTPDGTYYYLLQNIPITDDILGFNIVFVFSTNGTDAGQKELEVQVLNNPVQLSAFPTVVLDQVSGNNVVKDVDIGSLVSDVETPDNEITWSFSGFTNVVVNLISNTLARFSAASTFQGIEVGTATANDNDGSTASQPVTVQSGVPSVTLNSPNGGEAIFGTTIITWVASDIQNNALTITLQYSNDNGATYNTIASGLSNTGSYSWDTTGLAQGNQYLVKVIATDSGGLSGEDVSDGTFIILAGPDVGLSVQITADKTSGNIPLEVEFDSIVTGGNLPFTYAWDFTGDNAADSTLKSPTAVFKKEGIFTITLTVTDFDGDTATDTITINARPKAKIAREIIYIGGIAFNKIYYQPGDTVDMFVRFENKGDEDLNDVRLTAISQELGVRSNAVKVELTDSNEESETLQLEIPESAQKGRYWIELVIDIDGDRRVKYRPIDII